MRKKDDKKMSWTEKMVLLNELQKEDERRKMRMTDEQIIELWNSFERDDSNPPFINFARAIEERHGIK